MESREASGRVLVLEDDAFMCEALSVGLRSRGFEVEARSDGTNVDEVISRFRPEMMVLDLSLGDGPDGVSIASRVRATSDAGVIFISGSHRLEDRLAGFAVGGDDFLTKPFSMSELFARVDAVRRRRRPAASRPEVGGVVIDEEAHRVTRHGNDVPLTPTEYSLLEMLARRPGRVFSKRELLDLVWQFDHYDVNLVEVHVHGLRRKLERFGPRVVQTVRGVGYVLREPDDA